MAKPKLQYSIGNSASTTLASGMTDSATTAALTSDTNFQAAPVAGEGLVLIDEGTATEELAYATGVSGGSLTIPLANRGLEGGSPQPHDAGASIKGVMSADMWNDLVESLENILDPDTGAVKSGAVIPGPDFNGTEMIIDADADTTIAADTDDQIDYKLGGSDRFRMKTSDFDLVTTTANIQVAGADPKRTFYIPASAMFPSTTNPCGSLTQVESATNDVNIKVLDFDGAGSAKESAEFGIQSPTYWDASTITVQFVWYASAGSGTVNWEAQAVAFSDDDALDTAYGTLQEVSDTLLATGDVHISAETSAITVAGTPVAGDWLNIRVNRDPANDTNTSDARLMGVRVRFGIAQFNDA